jgi:hypothetical protein
MTVEVLERVLESVYKGGGTFGAKVDYPTGTGPIGLAVVDLDGDGRPDVITANQP